MLEHGYVRAADAWHLACAMLVSPAGAPMTFLTLDRQQQDVANRLGFETG